MKPFFRLVFLLFIALSSTGQTRIDPSFLAQRIYEPASATAALELSNGTRLVFGAMHANQMDVPGLVAYQPNGQVDAQFQANLSAGTWTEIKGAAEAPGGKIWLVARQASYGANTYFELFRLNADGSLDLNFMPQTAAWGSIRAVAAQPDGKIVVVGSLQRPGSTGTVGALRLNADGSLDTAFNTRLENVLSSLYSNGAAVALQPDGTLVMAFDTRALVRINSDGSRDTSFAPSDAGQALLLNTFAIGSLALQPDGKILVGAATGNTSLLAGSTRYFLRLGATGILDNTFTPNGWLCPERTAFIVPTVQVRPTGQILLAVDQAWSSLLPASRRYIAQLLPNGAFDPAWQFPTTFYFASDFGEPATSVQLLPSGQVLVAGGMRLTSSALNLPTGVHLLQGSGAVVSSFAPLLQKPSTVDRIVLQANGKIIVGGQFSEVNGVVTRNLARLAADGSIDAGFMARCPFATESALSSAVPLLSYPDGRMLIGGFFTLQHNGQQYAKLVRLLANGRLDSTFVNGVFATGSPYRGSNLSSGAIFGAGLQPNGSIIVIGMPGSGASYQGSSFLVRITDTGQLDPSFQPAIQEPTALLVQPDGRLRVGTEQPAGVAGLLANGSSDPSFAPVIMQNGTATANINGLTTAPNGNILVNGEFTSAGGVTTSTLARLLPNGAVDAGFVVAPSTIRKTFYTSTAVFGMAVQPNGRVLVGGMMEAAGFVDTQFLLRLLPNGALDVPFALATKPNRIVGKLVVQPDGAILLSGSYTTVGTQAHLGLSRLLDPDVLQIASQQLMSKTAAWPVPAHAQLHLSLDATAQPQMVQLLDVLGREVLRQTATQPEMTIGTSAVAPGTYLLRVDYAGGTVTRRVVIE